MIRFSLNEIGNLNILFDKALLLRLEDVYSNYKLFLTKLASKGIINQEKNKAAFLFREPCVSTLFHLTEGAISRPDATDLIKRINANRLDDPLHSRNMIAVIQDAIYLPKDEKGKNQFQPLDLTDNEIGELIAEFEVLKDIFGLDWSEFMSPVNVMTIISVPGYDDLPYFSGSGSDIFGAIHLARPATQASYAEMLTHEAAHHWCHLIEDLGMLSEECWSGDVWPSPWRNEPRPLGGVIHGSFVFAAAAVTLCSLKLQYDREENKESKIVETRIAYLLAQVEEGIRICIDSGLIAQNGKMLINSASEALQYVYPHITIRVLESARELLTRRMKTKFNLWRDQNLTFNADKSVIK